MKIIIEFNCDNDAFNQDWECEIAKVLGQAGDFLTSPDFGHYTFPKALLDSNGNSVGLVYFRKDTCALCGGEGKLLVFTHHPQCTDTEGACELCPVSRYDICPECKGTGFRKGDNDD